MLDPGSLTRFCKKILTLLMLWKELNQQGAYAKKQDALKNTVNVLILVKNVDLNANA